MNASVSTVDQQRTSGGGLNDADDERQQAPRGHVVDRRAGQRDDAELRLASCRRSDRIRASTGNAVIDMATPRNSAKLVNGTSLVENARVQIEGQRRCPARTAATMLGVRDRDGGVDLAAQQIGIQLEADQEHVEDDAELGDDAEERGDRRRQDERDRPSGAERARGATARAGCRR